MAGNVVSGRVVIKESGVGVPDLLVVMYDLDPNTTSEDDPADRGGIGDRLGSRLTDASGSFEIAFEDGDLQVRNPKERRPDLQISVLLPEDADADGQSRVLYTSKDVRANAGRNEQYLIRIPRETLDRAGVILPVVRPRSRDAGSIVTEFQVAQAWRNQLEVEAKKLASQRVTEARSIAKRTDDLVEARVYDALSGMTAAERARHNVLQPGQKAGDGVIASLNKRRIQLDEDPGSIGYLVLTEAEAAPLRELAPGGGWRSQVDAAVIEPLLFRLVKPENRPTTVTRNDPIATFCRAEALASSVRPLPAPPAAGDPPTAPAAPGPATNGSTPPDSRPGGMLELSTQDLPRLVARVFKDLEEPSKPPAERPTARVIGTTIQELELGAGPADVTAFHDYHSLQIAFDYVWEQLIDRDALEVSKALARQVEDSGGDVAEALRSEADPVKALARETQYIARALRPFESPVPDWVLGSTIEGYSTPGTGGQLPPGGGGGGGGSGGSGGGGGSGGQGSSGVRSGVRTDLKSNIGAINDYVLDPVRKPPHEILGLLEEILTEKYKFDIFAAGSTNFGLLVTYRQKWEPETYQVGDLVHTVTLAPKESRKVTTKRTVNRERVVKETENNVRNRTEEQKSTRRADAEVVERALTKTNFNLNAKGTYDLFVAAGDSTTTVDRTAEAASQETKKSFHEDVITAAMQLRTEKGWSFENKESSEDEETTTSEIQNTNDELTCTYLFYELERRYRVSEHLHRLTPVILVAMEVPNPERKAIDKVLLTHSWVINRVLLDDRYRVALDYLCTKMVGDELGLDQMGKALSEIRVAVDHLKHLASEADREIRATRDALDLAIRERANRVKNGAGDGLLVDAYESLFGDGGGEDVESARIVEDMRREALEQAARRQQEIRMQLQAETATYNAAAREYAEAYAAHMNRRVEVGALRAHVKENILYYMQAIWSFRFKDQTFFSVYKILAPTLEEAGTSYRIERVETPPLSIAAPPDRLVFRVTAKVSMPELDADSKTATLAELANLDQPLGFKGNYMIFPLKRANPLVDLMTIPYVDTELGLRDPDDLGSWSPDAFAAYVRCMLDKHKDEPGYAELERRLVAQYQQILGSPRRGSDTVIVPTDSLFIEALPGKHPLLEDFKLQHRALDVDKVREEARKLRLESLRYAARILGNDYQDPDIDRKIVVSGTDGIVVPTDP